MIRPRGFDARIPTPTVEETFFNHWDMECASGAALVDHHPLSCMVAFAAVDMVIAFGGGWALTRGFHGKGNLLSVIFGHVIGNSFAWPISTPSLCFTTNGLGGGALPFSVGKGLLPIRYWYRTGKCLVCPRRVPSFLYLD